MSDALMLSATFFLASNDVQIRSHPTVSHFEAACESVTAYRVAFLGLLVATKIGSACRDRVYRPNIYGRGNINSNVNSIRNSRCVTKELLAVGEN